MHWRKACLEETAAPERIESRKQRDIQYGKKEGYLIENNAFPRG